MVKWNNPKAKQAKPIEVKPKRVTKVKAEKGKKKGDNITKYFKSADTTKARPSAEASQLSPSKSKLKESDQADNP